MITQDKLTPHFEIVVINELELLRMKYIYNDLGNLAEGEKLLPYFIEHGNFQNLCTLHILRWKDLENGMDKPYQLLRTGYFKLLNVKGKTIVSEIVSLKDNFNKDS